MTTNLMIEYKLKYKPTIHNKNIIKDCDLVISKIRYISD